MTFRGSAPLAVLGGIPLVVALAGSLAPAPRETGAALGRLVYRNEGCINCHSQYVRPDTIDQAYWGEARPPDFSRGQSPALIGNRRQGPDLMNVGLRRTRAWQRAHLIDPRNAAPTSRMPSYAHLFAGGDERGEALLDYLNSLGREPAADPAASVPVPAAVR